MFNVFKLGQIQLLAVVAGLRTLHTGRRRHADVFEEHVGASLQILGLFLGVGNVAKHIRVVDRVKVTRCRLIVAMLANLLLLLLQMIDL